jgi:UDP-N-acetylglucosamine diphosphorylase/glucosamine-1-phosphate N-acetyltransferase
MVAFGAKIRPNTTLGPTSRVGGDVGNSIFHGYSNKAHDGFLSNSYIGEWCNLGANTNNSNLKNDYKTVKLYNYNTHSLYDTNELYCGTFMGDYSKAGISTMFNTGTVVGVSCNIFGSDFQENFVDSFSWGGKTNGYQTYKFEKAIEVINATMARREKKLNTEEIEILSYISKNK